MDTAPKQTVERPFKAAMPAFERAFLAAHIDAVLP